MNVLEVYFTLLTFRTRKYISQNRALTFTVCKTMDFVQPAGFVEGDFNEHLFSDVLQNVSEKAQYIGHEEIPFSDGTGYVSNVGSSDNTDSTKRVVGFRAFRLRYQEQTDEVEKSIGIVFKIKLKGSDSWRLLSDLMVKQGYDELGNSTLNKPFDTTLNSELKEIACFNILHPTWNAIRPNVFITLKDSEKEIFAIAMEDLGTDSFTHMDTIKDVSTWKDHDIKDVLQGISAFHALYYGKTEKIPDDIKKPVDASNIVNPYTDPRARSYIICATEHNLEKHTDLIGTMASKILRKSIDNMDEVCAILGNYPVTLIHNDFNIRNLCLRKNPKPNESRLCVYDWEVVRIANPQHDIAEFIAFILPEDSPIDSWDAYLEVYQGNLFKELEKLGASPEILKTVSSEDKFKSVFHMCIIELLWNRIGSIHLFEGDASNAFRSSLL